MTMAVFQMKEGQLTLRISKKKTGINLRSCVK